MVIQLHGYNPANPRYVRWWAADSRHTNLATEFSNHKEVIYLAEATGITYSRTGNMLSVNPQGVNARTFSLHYVNATAARELIVKMLTSRGGVGTASD